MNKKNLFIIASLLAVLVACSTIPKQAYYNRGEPEGLTAKSTEVVNFKIASPASVEEITSWINRDQPTRAILKCSESDALCGEVQSVLHQFGIPVKFTSAPENNVALLYETVQVRDCENRYIDNPINPYNLNYPTFGCTLSVNMAQMVTDKRQLTNPALTDYSDAQKSNQAMGFYNTPAAFSPAKVDTNFQALATQENISSSDAGSSSR